MHITDEIVLNLAPDVATYDRGRGLAIPQRWVDLMGNGNAIWGGVAVNKEGVFTTAVDLVTPPIAFKCDCPVKRKPCKHGIGLLLLFLRQPEIFGATDPPKEIAEWIDKRASKKTPKEAPNRTPEQEIQFEINKANKYADRKEAMNAGLKDIRLWMQDLARFGIANAMQQGPTFWQNIAARCTDAKLGGFGRLFRAIAFRHALHPDDVGTIADRIAEIWLAIRAFDKFDYLEPSQQDDLLALAGVNTPKSSLEQQPSKHDTWIVVGVRHGKLEDELNPLAWRRTHLYGLQSRRFATLIDFLTPPTYTYENNWTIGHAFQGEVIFYPSAYPMRAIVKNGTITETPPIEALTGLDEMLRRRAEALGKNPWIRTFPFMVEGSVQVRDEYAFFLTDSLQHQLPLQCNATVGWQLVALCGGNTRIITCEFEGNTLAPIGIFTDGQWHSINEK